MCRLIVIYSLRRHRGHPAKLNAGHQRRITRFITSGEADNAAQVTKLLTNDSHIDCSVYTVRRALKKSGFRAIVKQKRPRLSAKHVHARLAFALKHQHWTFDDWKRVIWSDETKINRLGSDGREMVWIGSDRD